MSLAREAQPIRRGSLLYYPMEALAEKLHVSFKGHYTTKKPSVDVSPRFKMTRTHEFKIVHLTPEQRRTVSRRDWPEPESCGWHYRLSPLEDMPLDDVVAEVQRITATPCCSEAHGEASSWVPDDDMPWPTEMAMTCIASSLQWLYQQDDVDTDIRVFAALEYDHMWSVDMKWEDLLADQRRTKFALCAMDHHNPSFSEDDDGGFESDFFTTRDRLRKEVEHGNAVRLAEIQCSKA